jgi:hypothetical protein
MDEHGIVYDYTNGIDDLKMNRIRFNGNIISRLQENPIRILRYFRSEENISSPKNIFFAILDSSVVYHWILMHMKLRY